MELVPRPALIEPHDGHFAVPVDLEIAAPPEWADIARRLLSPGTGLALNGSERGRLRIHRDDRLPAEAYRLSVDASGITAAAGDSRGVNWAIQTLRQLLPASAALAAPTGRAPLLVPAVQIADRPRFRWRGVMLDVARHFFTLAELCTLVDLLALHKYNVLHLHLTDDQGWRFESRRHPRLNDVASWRTETRRPGDEVGDGTPHGGLLHSRPASRPGRVRRPPRNRNRPRARVSGPRPGRARRLSRARAPPRTAGGNGDDLRRLQRGAEPLRGGRLVRLRRLRGTPRRLRRPLRPRRRRRVSPDGVAG